MKIAEIRQIIRAAMWVRNDLVGGTAEEFRKQAVGPRLEEKIAELRALEIAPRFAQDAQSRQEEIARCEAVIARWQAAQIPHTAAAAVVTAARIDRLAREWSEIAGEPVGVTEIKGTFYGMCSELGAYRLEHKYNNRPKCEAIYSKPYGSWAFRLETDLH